MGEQEQVVRGVKDCLGTIITMTRMIGKLTQKLEGRMELEAQGSMEVFPHFDGGFEIKSHLAGNDGKRYIVNIVAYERR